MYRFVVSVERTFLLNAFYEKSFENCVTKITFIRF